MDFFSSLVLVLAALGLPGSYFDSSNFSFYATIFVSIILVLFGLYYLYSKLLHEGLTATMLLERRQHILKEIKLLHYRLLKREIDQKAYRHAYSKKNDELTLVHKQILELDKGRRERYQDEED